MQVMMAKYQVDMASFSRESKYEIRVLRVVACVRKFLYTVTQKMRVYELKLAKMAKKTAKIRPGATERPYGLRPKKIAQNHRFARSFAKKN